MKWISLLVVALLCSPLWADDTGDHTHGDIKTPFAFKYASERQYDGLSFVIRPNGHTIVFAPAGVWFSKDAGELGSSIAWRWEHGPETGPFQDSNCLYESFFGNSVCNSDLYALEDGIYDHETIVDLGRSFNHVELPGHVTDMELLYEHPQEFLDSMWIGGTTESLQRTPQGLKILPDAEFNVGTGPWLVLPVAVPEPSSFVGVCLALLSLAFLRR